MTHSSIFVFKSPEHILALCTRKHLTAKTNTAYFARNCSGFKPLTCALSSIEIMTFLLEVKAIIIIIITILATETHPGQKKFPARLPHLGSSCSCLSVC